MIAIVSYVSDLGDEAGDRVGVKLVESHLKVNDSNESDAMRGVARNC